MSFSSFDLDEDLLRGINDLGFTEATPIQLDTIPAGLEGRDILACAMTGSGKTAAFLLPILHQIKKLPRGTTRALVLVPTRELAAQIVEHMGELSTHTDLTGAAVYGGVAPDPQEKAFRDGVDLIAATPGRLLDHFQHPYAALEGLEYLVLDEADRMLDMGFLPDLRRIVDQLPKPKQNFLLSATMPDEIIILAHEMLEEPVTLNLDRQAEPATGITQAVYPVRESLKRLLLLELLQRGEIDNVLVFTRTKHRANRLAEFLRKNGISCERIHSNRSQRQRTEALEGFKEGKYVALVATDIASRGIDVEALSHVINFDVPSVADDYIHRIGRTARAQATGEAFTFVSRREVKDLRAIEEALGKALPRLTLNDFDYDADAKEDLEIPLDQRMAKIRERKAQEGKSRRARSGRQERGAGGGQGGGSGKRKPQPRGRRKGAGPRGGNVRSGNVRNGNVAGGNVTQGNSRGGNFKKKGRGKGRGGKPFTGVMAEAGFDNGNRILPDDSAVTPEMVAAALPASPTSGQPQRRTHVPSALRRKPPKQG